MSVTKVLPANATTGGGPTALDGVDGNTLVDGDVALVVTDAGFYPYILDAAVGGTEVDPFLIAPDQNAGTKRWVLKGMPNNLYVVSADAVDQGSDNNDHSIKDWLSTIGTSANATLYFPNAPGSSTTTYTVATDLTLASYPNIRLRFDRGARLSIDVGITLTLYSPDNIDAGMTQQIFAGSGSYAFSEPGIFHVGWSGADPTGVTPCAALLNTVSSALPAYSIIALLPGGTYDLDTTTWSTTKSISIVGNGTNITYGGTGTAVSHTAATGTQIVRTSIKGIVITLDARNWTDATCIGLYLQNWYQSRVVDVEIANFYYGLYLTALNTGNVYNWYQLSKLNNNRVDVYMVNQAGGWVNQNTFMLQRCATSNFTVGSNRASKTTVSFDQASKEIRDSEGALDFTTLFAADDFIYVSGSVSNDEIYKIASVAAAAITVNETLVGGKATPIITEAAGASITLGHVGMCLFVPKESVYNHNGNVLINPSFEGNNASKVGFVIEGSNNSIVEGRCELTGRAGYISGNFNNVRIVSSANLNEVTLATPYNDVQMPSGEWDYRYLYGKTEAINGDNGIRAYNNSTAANEYLKLYDALNLYKRYSLSHIGRMKWYNSTGVEVCDLLAGAGGIGIGDGTNYTEIETDGTLHFNGNATVFKDINQASVGLGQPAAGAPGDDKFLDEAGGDTGIYTKAYDINEYSCGVFELQHDYKEGSNITFHVHWQGIAAPSGTDYVAWELTYTITRDANTMNAVTTITSPDTAIATRYASARSDFAAIVGSTGGVDGGNIKIGDQFNFKIKRVAAAGDAYAGDALMHTCGIHYEVDTVGSRTITAK